MRSFSGNHTLPPTPTEPQFIYSFEEIGPDLPRPPLSAIRAMFSAGLMVSPAGWQKMPFETRRALCAAGARAVPDATAVKELLRPVPPTAMKFVGVARDPDREAPPAAILRAVEPIWPMTAHDWQSLTSLDRFVLLTLHGNTLLLGRAVTEIVRALGRSGLLASFWRGDLAHVELRMSAEALEQISSPAFLDGRALLLARTAGVRAARVTPELLDMAAHLPVGPVELDWALRPAEGYVLFQAHASTWEGAFAPAAALLAATTAAVALRDMLRGVDDGASISFASVVAEAWQAGSGLFVDEATIHFSGG